MIRNNLLVWPLVAQAFCSWAWAEWDKNEPAGAPRNIFKASTHQIQEPGVGTPGEQETFMAIKTDGYLPVAREKAMDEVRFQARQKGLAYEILQAEEEKLGFGYRVKIRYRLRPEVAEVVDVPEETWWANLLKKIQAALPYLKKAIAEVEIWVNSSTGKGSNAATEPVP